MKKFFQFVGIMTLLCGSFFYTEKTVSVVNQMDELMIQIKEQASIDKTDPIDADIVGKTVTPGVSGKQIDIAKSYQKMKQYGAYTPKLLIYESVKPKRSILNIYDKYVIGGNKNLHQTSIIFLVEEKTEIKRVQEILKKEGVSANFFIDGNWLEKHNESMLELIQSGHVIGNLSYHRDYTDSSFVWMNTIIRRIGNQKQGYCYTEKQDQTVLNHCKLQKSYTILPTIVGRESPLNTIKENIQPGSIISLPINQVTEEQILTVIRYIKSRGYQIVTLTKLLEE